MKRGRIMKSNVELMDKHWNSPGMHTDPEYLANIIRYEKDPEKRIASIIFDDPKNGNACPVAGFERVVDLIRDAESDDDISVVVFRGIGPHLGTGADANELGHYIGYGKTDAEGNLIRPNQRQRLLPDRNIIFNGYERAIADCLKVTICAAHGYCYGSHFQLVLASDIVIATPDALFGHPAIRYIGPSAQNTHIWMRSLGIKRMKELMFTGRPLDADEAMACGMINRIVPNQDLDQTVEDYARAVSLMSLDSIMMAKAMIQTYEDAEGKGLGSMIAVVGHGWSTNQVLRKGEWNFLKARRELGLAGALKQRDAMVAPMFRMGGRWKPVTKSKPRGKVRTPAIK